MSDARARIEFRGRVACQRDPSGPLGLTLIGRALHPPDEALQVAFSAVAPADLPQTLQDAIVEQLDARHYRIVSGGHEWRVEAVGHVHREVGDKFCEVLPPRPVPWRKRIFWWLALRAAAHSVVQRLLIRPRV